MTLGAEVVYVVGRGDDRVGGVFHRPGPDMPGAFTTLCGVPILHATLMQSEWAAHTGAEACPDCYPEG